MKLILAVCACLLCAFLLVGCDQESEVNDVPDQTENLPANTINPPEDAEPKDAPENEPPITVDVLTEDDFIVRYNDVLISDQIPFAEVAQQLEIPINDDLSIKTDNATVRAAGNKENFSYTWYRVLYPYREDAVYDDQAFFYPNQDNADMVIDYVVNETEQKAWLVFVDLLNSNVETYRGLKTGDEEQLFLEKYGTGYESRFNREDTQYYWLEIPGDDTLGNPTKNISLVIDYATKNILEITLDYGSNETMEYLGIQSLGE